MMIAAIFRQHTLAAAIDVYHVVTIKTKMFRIGSKSYPFIRNLCNDPIRLEDSDPNASKKNANYDTNSNKFYGRSNFMQMLQYQNMAGSNTSRPHPKKNILPKKQRMSSVVHKHTQFIRQRQQSNKEKNETHHTKSRRSINRRDYMNIKNIHKKSDLEPRNVASSNWILITKIPPMSTLSDIISSIEKIIEFEIDKGVIDLEKIDDYINVGVNLDQRRANLDQIGALESFYTAKQVDIASGIPLWSPGSSDEELPHNMIMEARLYLSQHARPRGWFLRLPSRSIVHAILKHNEDAEKREKLEAERLKLEENILKQERRKWREGLWKGVWSDHQNRLVTNDNKKLLDDENEEEWDLAWGIGTDERLNVFGEKGMSAVEPHALDEEDEVAFDYLDDYSQSNPYPYPEQFKSQTDAPSSGLRLLTCGMVQLKIEEFVPQPHAYKFPSWEQTFFCLSPLLNLSDSVVRVETEAHKSVDDIRYLFRGYDLESILPEAESMASSLPSSCIDYVTLLGWKTNPEGNVALLIHGQLKSTNPRHTFLVRFASPATARMAVRDELDLRQDGDVLTMTQFPNPILK